MQHLQKSGGYPAEQPSRNSAIERFAVQKLLLASLILAGAAFTTLSQEPGSSSPAAARTDQTAILVGAGDIADCRDLSGAEATAKLLDQLPGTVMALGDLADPDC